MRQMPLIRDAGPGDIRLVLGVYSACIAADADYLPFLEAGDEQAVLAWFLLKPLLACLLAEHDGLIVGVAGLRDAEPGPGAGMPGGRWLEACRLAVHPAHRGGAVTRDLTSARASHAVSLGADRLWMRCVEDSRSHRLALAHGWTWWARTEFEGPAAAQRAILLARMLNDRCPLGRRRSPIIRLSSVIKRSRRRGRIETILVHSHARLLE